MAQDLLASHVEAIYGADLAEFTAERDRRVKQLKAEGHKDEAAALKAHRKPTVPAWAVDQVARTHGERIETLIEAADELRALQHRAASGRRAEGMREASQRLRDLVGDLREAAGRILAAAGTRADAHLDEIEQTIFAAAVDPQHHDTLRRGVLAAVLPGPGFGGLGLGLAVLPAPPEQDDDTAADAAYDETAEGLAAAAEAEEAHAAAVAERTKQRRAVQRRIDALEAARDKQAERAATAREEADGLRVRADAAADAAAAAEADLAEYDDDLAAARADLAALGDA